MDGMAISVVCPGFAGDDVKFPGEVFLVFGLGLFAQLPLATFESPGFAQEKVTEPLLIDEFLAAAHSNDIAALAHGLDRGVHVDSRDRRGRTALLIATYANAVDAARLLIESGADVNAKDGLSDSPYLYAGAEGRLEILKMTVAAGADLKSVNRYGGTALTPAAHHGHVEVVRYMLTTRVDVNQINRLGWTALLEAVILGDGGKTYRKIVRLLVEAGADTSIGDHDGVTALEHARACNQREIIKLLEKASP